MTKNLQLFQSLSGLIRPDATGGEGQSGAVPPQMSACAPPNEICAPPSEDCAPKKLTKIGVIYPYFRNFCELTRNFMKFLG